MLDTVKLLYDVYEGTTEQKKCEARIIRKKLREELSRFKEYVREYQEEEMKDEKEDLLFQIKKELRASSPFAAFKRWLIRDNQEQYPELAGLLKEI